jgi:hypothetical protein
MLKSREKKVEHIERGDGENVRGGKKEHDGSRSETGAARK